MATSSKGKKVLDAATPDHLEKILDQLSNKTKRRLGAILKNLGTLKGKDRTYAIASTFASILHDTGKLPGELDRSEFNDLIGTFDIIDNWDNLSDIKKFTIGGKKIIDLANKYGDQKIPYAGDALGLAAIGYNQHQLINNWDEMDSMQKIVGIANTYSNAGDAYNLFTNLTSSATTQGAAQVGAQAVAEAGTQAAAQGSAQVATEVGTQAAAEIGSQGAAAGAELSGAEIAGNAAAVIAGAYGVYQMVDNFGTGGSAGRASGAMSGVAAGGGAVAAGALMGMKMGSFAGPIGMAIGAVIGLVVGSVKTGKSVEQGARDSYRDFMKESGVFGLAKDFQQMNESGNAIDGTFAGNLINAKQGEDISKFGGQNHVIQLADGALYNVGADGSDSRALTGGQTKTFSDESKILSRDVDNIANGNELRPYDVDYTNDLDMMTNVSLKGLEFLMGGGSEQSKKSTEFGQMFGYMTNAATSNANGREFTEENFNTSMANVRKMYADAGITNSDQAHNMLNQLKAEGKISENDFNTSAQAIRMAFSGDFSYAQELNSTRWDGLESEQVGGQQDFINNGEGPLDEEGNPTGINPDEVQTRNPSKLPEDVNSAVLDQVGDFQTLEQVVDEEGNPISNSDEDEDTGVPGVQNTGLFGEAFENVVQNTELFANNRLPEFGDPIQVGFPEGFENVRPFLREGNNG